VRFQSRQIHERLRHYTVSHRSCQSLKITAEAAKIFFKTKFFFEICLPICSLSGHREDYCAEWGAAGHVRLPESQLS
jgi:hypothetical protein